MKLFNPVFQPDNATPTFDELTGRGVCIAIDNRHNLGDGSSPGKGYTSARGNAEHADEFDGFAENKGTGDGAGTIFGQGSSDNRYDEDRPVYDPDIRLAYFTPIRDFNPEPITLEHPITTTTYPGRLILTGAAMPGYTQQG
jgi:hypothetical protein